MLNWFSKKKEVPLLSFVVIDSRGENHPDWLNECVDSIRAQDIPVELILVPNRERKYTIGQCWNAGVRDAKCDWVAFVGDDDFVAFDYARTLNNWINHIKNRGSNEVNVATYMTFFENSTGHKTFKPQQSTGAWKKEYLLKHPFNEELQTGIDREYIEESLKRGELALMIEYYFGYFYRKVPKSEDYSCAGEIEFVEEPRDYYFCTSNRIFLDPITRRFKQTVGEKNVIISPHAEPEMIGPAKMIFVEWANTKALQIQNANIDAFKAMRLHAYEAFQDTMKYLDWNKWDLVILIDNYIKEYIEKQYGKIKNAVVIPNGVELGRFTLDPNKKKNKKIAYAGYLSRKKGIGELILLAESLPEYEFHCAGRYQEDDIADYFNHRKPKNVILHEWKYEDRMNEFYQDKSFVLNTSLRESQAMTICEGMSCGCKPIVRRWLGVDEVYEPEWTYDSIDEVKEILESDWEPKEYRNYVEKKWDIEKIYPKIERLMLDGVKKKFNQKVKVA